MIVVPVTALSILLMLSRVDGHTNDRVTILHVTYEMTDCTYKSL